MSKRQREFYELFMQLNLKLFQNIVRKEHGMVLNHITKKLNFDLSLNCKICGIMGEHEKMTNNKCI